MKIFCWILGALLLWAGHAQAADKDLRIVFIPKSSDQVFWELMRAGVDKAVQEDPHIQLTWRGPAHNDDTEAQIKIVQVYSRAGVDAIVIAPTDRARLVEPIRKAVEMGIKVVSVDSGLDGDYHTSFVTSNNYAGGQLAAKTLAEKLGKKGRVLVLRTVQGSASTDDRANGFIRYMQTNVPGITVVADAYGGGSAGKARHSAAALLQQKKPIDGVFAVNESSTDGMLRALRETGLAGKLHFIGFDSTDFLLAGLETRELDGLVIQSPNQMGYMSIKAAVAALAAVPAVPGQAGKDKTIFTETTLVTRENYKTPEIQRMMCSRC